MTAICLNGKSLQQQCLAQLQSRVAALQSQSITPAFGLLQVGDDPASTLYTRLKREAAARLGIQVDYQHHHTDLPRILAQLQQWNSDPLLHGIMVQLPLPSSLPTHTVLERIAPEKDIDGCTSQQLGWLSTRDPRAMLSATPAGVLQLLQHYEIPLQGQHVCIISDSRLIGRPLSLALLNAGATITICHAATVALSSHTRMADIVCTAVGKPGLLTAAMLRPGAVVVDIGISPTAAGTVVGDSVQDEAFLATCSTYTPVPGGVGPMTIASLLQNVIHAAEESQIS
ncbi:bifunctional 5,10-methylenetetrahydrofolate dehydrogenase/5,10-methenyltetrahydrofolate cyclohydrolase [Candidatus Peribacteria bacterium]|nr:bifunctional 5,10-methylenetetrahydrofolate dehydrogenase/5,10-methenyltetrahydrofolate cyclohydrolase [Candidatus Peribacteria bacterium]